MRKKKEEEVNRTCPQHTEKATAPHSSTLTWRIPGTGEPGGLQSMGQQRVRHGLATEHTNTSDNSDCAFHMGTYSHLLDLVLLKPQSEEISEGPLR